MLAFKHLYAYSLTELLAVVFFVLLRCIHIMHSDYTRSQAVQKHSFQPCTVSEIGHHHL